MSDVPDAIVEVPVKLFIGRFPRSFSDEDLGELFTKFGKLKECAVLRDHNSRESKGCGFVRFAHLTNAVECIRQTNGKLVVDAEIGAIQVQFANGEVERLGLSLDQVEPPPVKLFVGCLPDDITPDQLHDLFRPFGDVVETFVLTDPESGESKGSGFVKMRTKADAQAAIQGLNKIQLSEDASKPLEVRLAVSRLQRQRKLSAKPPAVQLTRYSPIPAPRIVTDACMSTKAGPPGCNVFVFHVPPEWGEFHLRQLFANCGYLLSATIVRDKQTSMSKGFGFVSFDNPYSAQAAVAHLNGFMVGGKRLKVQLKRGDGGNDYALLAGG
jgi:RNA recognition motif-containing protein